MAEDKQPPRAFELGVLEGYAPYAAALCATLEGIVGRYEPAHLRELARNPVSTDGKSGQRYEELQKLRPTGKPKTEEERAVSELVNVLDNIFKDEVIQLRDGAACEELSKVRGQSLQYVLAITQDGKKYSTCAIFPIDYDWERELTKFEQALQEHLHIRADAAAPAARASEGYLSFDVDTRTSKKTIGGYVDQILHSLEQKGQIYGIVKLEHSVFILPSTYREPTGLGGKGPERQTAADTITERPDYVALLEGSLPDEIYATRHKTARRQLNAILHAALQEKDGFSLTREFSGKVRDADSGAFEGRSGGRYGRTDRGSARDFTGIELGIRKIFYKYLLRKNDEDGGIVAAGVRIAGYTRYIFNKDVLELITKSGIVLECRVPEERAEKSRLIHAEDVMKWHDGTPRVDYCSHYRERLENGGLARLFALEPAAHPKLRSFDKTRENNARKRREYLDALLWAVFEGTEARGEKEFIKDKMFIDTLVRLSPAFAELRENYESFKSTVNQRVEDLVMCGVVKNLSKVEDVQRRKGRGKEGQLQQAKAGYDVYVTL